MLKSWQIYYYYYRYYICTIKWSVLFVANKIYWTKLLKIRLKINFPSKMVELCVWIESKIFKTAWRIKKWKLPWYWFHECWNHAWNSFHELELDIRFFCFFFQLSHTVQYNYSLFVFVAFFSSHTRETKAVCY